MGDEGEKWDRGEPGSEGETISSRLQVSRTDFRLELRWRK